MGSRHFSQKQKLSILDSAAEIGVKKAAELAGVHHTIAGLNGVKTQRNWETSYNHP